MKYWHLRERLPTEDAQLAISRVVWVVQEWPDSSAIPIHPDDTGSGDVAINWAAPLKLWPMKNGDGTTLGAPGGALLLVLRWCSRKSCAAFCVAAYMVDKAEPYPSAFAGNRDVICDCVSRMADPNPSRCWEAAWVDILVLRLQERKTGIRLPCENDEVA
eukprot:6774069-Prymnesium_polylepis.3